MAFGDLKTEKGIKELNGYLADRSYIEGWVKLFLKCIICRMSWDTCIPIQNV